MDSYESLKSDSNEALVALAEFIRTNTELCRQSARAKGPFLKAAGLKAAGLSVPALNDTDPRLAQRFLECFALEASRAGKAVAPVQVFLSLGCPGLPPQRRKMVEALAESWAGVFLIIDEDENAIEIEDASRGNRLNVLLPPGERHASPGDTLLGRVFKLPETEFHFAMDSMEFCLGSCVFDAFQAVVSRRRHENGLQDLPRLSQLELEGLINLSCHGEQRSVELIEADLAAMLETVAAQGQQDLAANGPTTSRSQGLAELAPSELGKHVLGELERAEANGEERDLLFARLERLVDEVTESEEIGPPQEIHWHTDEAGNLRAFLEEFFWEHRKMRGEDYPEERKQALEDFARELESREVREIEGVAERHLAQILAPSWAQGGEASCLATVAALVDWEDWLKEVQELDFACNVQGFHGRLLTDRKRLASLTRQLGCRPAEAGAPQETAMAWTVQEGNAKEGWLLRGGGRELRLPGTLHFRLGDLILGQHVVTDGETDGTFREGVRLLPASLASGLLV